MLYVLYIEIDVYITCEKKCPYFLKGINWTHTSFNKMLNLVLDYYRSFVLINDFNRKYVSMRMSQFWDLCKDDRSL